MSAEQDQTAAATPSHIGTAPRDGTRILAWSWLPECWQAVKFHDGAWVTTWDRDPFPEPECWLPYPAIPADVADVR